MLPLANMGLPMIFVAWPMMGFALVPIVLLEAFIFRRALPDTRPLGALAMANVFSTVFGIPVAWFGMALLQWGATRGDARGPLVGATVGAAWLVPYEEHMTWMVPVAGICLLPAFFGMSGWIEAAIVAKVLKGEAAKAEVRRATWRANRASYVLLAGLWLVVFAWNLATSR